jgi:hypothetical protein
VLLAEKDELSAVGQEQPLNIERMKQHLDMLDHRLDDIDSMVSAIAERVLRQPISLIITCPYCGKNIEIAMIGSEKPRR